MFTAHYDDEDSLHLTWHKNPETNYSVEIGDGALQHGLDLLREMILSKELGIEPMDIWNAIARARAQRGGI